MIFLKLFWESVLFALNSLRVNKLRTTLSLLGITIGIFAIISVFTFVDHMETSIRNDVQSLGENVVYIQKWPWEFNPDFKWWDYIKRPQTQYKELAMVKKRCSAAQAVAFMASTGKTVKYRNSSVENAAVVAVSHEYEKIKHFDLLEGRYFSDVESAHGSNVAVIGYSIADGLFGPISPIQKKIKAFGRELVVIGVFNKEGESIFGSVDNQVLVPVRFARGVVDVDRGQFNPFIMVKPKEGITKDDLKAELKGVMRGIRKLRPKEKDDFSLNEISLLSAPMEDMFSTIGTIGLIIGIFSVLVGGFGIANIMFVSVKERTGIIGIQKSLGSKNYFILLQFLVESITLCLMGGLIGLLLIWLGTVIANSSIDDLDLHLTAGNIILGLTLSTIIGIISGFIPSYSASQLDPVEAIRAN